MIYLLKTFYEIQNEENPETGEENIEGDSSDNVSNENIENEEENEEQNSESTTEGGDEGEAVPAASSEAEGSGSQQDGETAETQGNLSESEGDYTALIESVEGLHDEFLLLHQANSANLFMIAVLIGVIGIKYLFDGLRNI